MGKNMFVFRAGRLLLLALLCAAALARGQQAFASESPLVMFGAGDEIFYDMRFLSLETGRVIFSFTPPMSSHEIRLFLDGIDTAALSDPALAAYDRINERLAPRAFFSRGGFAAAAGMTLAPALSFRTEERAGWILPDHDNPRMLSFPFDLYIMDSVHLHFESAFQRFPGVPRPIDGTGGLLSTNIPIDFRGGVTPLRAFGAVGGSFWNFQIGRDRISFGSGNTGNLLVSGHTAFHDFARLSFFADWIKYSVMVIHTPLFVSQSMVVRDFMDFPYYVFGEDFLRYSVHRYMYFHRLDVRLGRRFAISVTEQMVSGNSPMQLRYLNPLMFRHNLFSGDDFPRWINFGLLDNMLLSIDFQWHIAGTWRLYGQFGIDAFGTPFVSDRVRAEPNSLGYLLGLEFSASLGQWAALFFAEFVFTDPFFYADNSPFAASIWQRRRTNYGGALSGWVGHPNGRDAITLTFGSRFALQDRLVLNAFTTYEVQGVQGLAWDWGGGEEFFLARTPSGLGEHSITLGALSYWVPPFQPERGRLALQGGAAGRVVINHGHRLWRIVGGAEFLLGVSYSL
ncbi:MAG: hypothetical protein FWG66_09680 [Spirochaetes bacterium]|nr:hypothetical protein [Spirochaetota bacterium]